MNIPIDSILNYFTRLQAFTPKHDIVIFREAVYSLLQYFQLMDKLTP